MRACGATVCALKMLLQLFMQLLMMAMIYMAQQQQRMQAQ
jgi:preprotein translocase subunit YajC